MAITEIYYKAKERLQTALDNSCYGRIKCDVITPWK